MHNIIKLLHSYLREDGRNQALRTHVNFSGMLIAEH